MKDIPAFPYDIPKWCGMSKEEHHSVPLHLGGNCWGISSGGVKEKGIEYCKQCEFLLEARERNTK